MPRKIPPQRLAMFTRMRKREQEGEKVGISDFPKKSDYDAWRNWIAREEKKALGLSRRRERPIVRAVETVVESPAAVVSEAREVQEAEVEVVADTVADRWELLKQVADNGRPVFVSSRYGFYGQFKKLSISQSGGRFDVAITMQEFVAVVPSEIEAPPEILAELVRTGAQSKPKLDAFEAAIVASTEQKNAALASMDGALPGSSRPGTRITVSGSISG